MKKVLLTMAVLLWGLMVTSAMAGGNSKPNAASGEETGVSQAQIDIVTQQDEARDRRDEMLLKRAATIKAAEKQDARMNRRSSRKHNSN